jgi:hypothetical protein
LFGHLFTLGCKQLMGSEFLYLSIIGNGLHTDIC